MIYGCCHTNIDDAKREVWPTVFVAVPQKGDRVEAKSGRVLYVCGITHKSWGTSEIINKGDPYIEVELTNFNSARNYIFSK